jgi:hypothetical protein
VPGQPGFDVEYRVAAATYFATMGIPCARALFRRTRRRHLVRCLISKNMARKYPGGAVGKRLS